MSVPIPDLLEPIKSLHRLIRDSVVQACEEQSVQALSAVAKEEGGDTIFQIDRVSEATLVEVLAKEIAVHTPLVLIAEGLENQGMRVLPDGADAEEALLRIIVDPIDGTRGIMTQKRSAWILTGVAPNKGSDTCLADIELAVQTEIPLVKQHLCDTYWAVKGQGAFAERTNRLTQEVQPLPVRPSPETHLENGFITIARYFPGAQAKFGALYDHWMEQLLGPPLHGKAQCFEDQYISTGGHFAELMSGHDRIVADLRTVLKEGPIGLCSHPYDLCTELIAREAGVVVTNPSGEPLRAPLDVETDVGWIGMANQGLYDLTMPVLQDLLREG